MSTRGKKGWILAFSVPCLVLFCLVYAIPFVMVITTSFCDYSLTQSPVFEGLKNFKTIFADPDFSVSIVNTLKWVLIQSTLHVGFGFVMALILRRKPKSNTYLPNGMAEDEEAECARYEGIMKQLGNIDMQLLGIGLNGHIGFNEPGESFEKTTHCVQLTQSTIDANQRLFDEGEAFPEKAFTMGIKSIMQSKHILLIANGEKKAQIIRDAFFGPITPKVPASILQLHNNVTVIVDKEAGKLIKDVL